MAHVLYSLFGFEDGLTLYFEFEGVNVGIEYVCLYGIHGWLFKFEGS